MKNPIQLKQMITVAACMAVGTLSAQTLVDITGNGRYQIANAFTSNPAPSYVNQTWGKDSSTLRGVPNGGVNTWAQLAQFDLSTPAAVAAFNSAATFELSIGPNLASLNLGYSVHVLAGSVDLYAQPSGSNDPTWASTVLAGTNVYSGTASGAVSITGTALDGYLSGVDFSASPYIYVMIRPTESGGAGAVDLSGSSLTAVPEPATYASVLALLALALVAIRRRRQAC